MKIKNFLSALFLFAGISGFSQVTEIDYTISNKAPLYEIKINTGDLEEIQSIDWDMLRDINTSFSKKEELDSVKLIFNYEKPVMLDGSEAESFNYEVSGKMSEFENLIGKSKKALGKLHPVAKTKNL